MGQASYAGLTKRNGKGLPMFTGEFRVVPEMLDRPMKWTKPRTIFVNSMSDLFGEGVSNEFIAAVFGVMAATPRHEYQVLTKRADRMREWLEWLEAFQHPNISGCMHTELAGRLEDLRDDDAEELLSADWPLPNVWLGVSVESRDYLSRVDELLRTPTAVRFLSLEPLLGDLGTLDLSGIDWVIVGGESGPGARPCDLRWIDSVVGQCREADVPCFVKQLGSNPIYDCPAGEQALGQFREDGTARYFKIAYTTGKGGDPAEWTANLRVREMPRRAT